MIKPNSRHYDPTTKRRELTIEEMDRATGGAVQVRELVIKAVVVSDPRPPAPPSPMPVPMPNIAS